LYVFEMYPFWGQYLNKSRSELECENIA